MEATELRLGNFIGDKKGRICKIQSLEELNDITAYCVYGPITSLPYKPIPLTEEWLFKLGFDGCDMDMWIVIPFGNAIELHVDCIFPGKFTNVCLTVGRTLKGVPGKDYQYLYLKKIKYVHQLQNLYHALTGEELTLRK